MLRIGQIEATATTDKKYTDGSVAGGIAATRLRAAAFNAMQEELAHIVEEAGLTLDVNDATQVLAGLRKLLLSRANPFAEIKADGTVATALANLGLKEAAVGVSLVGDSRNAKMNIPTASATATFTADEVVVAEAIGGKVYRVANVNKTMNLATAGAGGLDTGSMTSGYCAVYLIYNPATNASALLGYNATSAVAPEIYAGANMPAGYTASALISVWRVASSQFVVGYQFGRKITFPEQTAVNTNVAQSTFASFTLSTSTPPNARFFSGNGNVNSTVVASNNYFSVAASAAGFDARRYGTGNSGILSAFNDVAIITPQVAYYILGTSGTLTTSFITITDYTF